MTPQPATATVRSHDGAVIAYDVAGAGPAVFFLHGLITDRHRWAPVTELLHDTFTCVRIDARGHGESSKAADYGPLAMAGDVHVVADAIGVDAPAVVGHSLGGSVAVLFGLAHRARALVVVEQSLRIGDFAARIRPLEARLRGDGFAAAMREFESGLGLGLLGQEGVDRLHAAIDAADRDVVLGVWSQLFASSDEQLDAAMAAALPHLSPPCLLLHGSPPADGYAEWVTALVPHAQLEVWDGMGHFPHLVDPPRFAARLRLALGDG